MANAAYPTQNIHLPTNHTTLMIALFVSQAGSVFILIATIILFFDWLFGMHTFGPSLTNLPVIAALIISAVAIFFYKKSNKFQLLGLALILIGLFIFLTSLNGQTPNLAKNGIFFFFIGLSLIASILKIPHRYHFMQIITVAILTMNLYSFLAHIYELVSFKANFNPAFWESIVFFILCQSILFIKPDRGFVGLFTSESRSAQLARMSLLYFTSLPICLGFFFLILGNLQIFDLNGRLALLVVVTILVSIIISWINIKVLYPTEVEHFVMKEALRVNNISLELDAEQLTSQVVRLEDDKQKIADKLNNEQTLSDIVGGSE